MRFSLLFVAQPTKTSDESELKMNEKRIKPKKKKNKSIKIEKQNQRQKKKIFGCETIAHVQKLKRNCKRKLQEMKQSYFYLIPFNYLSVSIYCESIANSTLLCLLARGIERERTIANIDSGPRTKRIL